MPGHHAYQLSLSPVPEKMRGTGADYFFDKVTEIEEIPNVIEELAKDKPENVKKKQ